MFRWSGMSPVVDADQTYDLRSHMQRQAYILLYFFLYNLYYKSYTVQISTFTPHVLINLGVFSQFIHGFFSPPQCHGFLHFEYIWCIVKALSEPGTDLCSAMCKRSTPHGQALNQLNWLRHSLFSISQWQELSFFYKFRVTVIIIMKKCTASGERPYHNGWSVTSKINWILIE